MPDFMFAYHGGKKPETQEEITKIMDKWNTWVAQLGDAAVNPGTPVGMSKTVSTSGISDDGGSNPLMGYSIIRAESMEAVLELAKGCPHLQLENGTIEVAEIKFMM